MINSIESIIRYGNESDRQGGWLEDWMRGMKSGALKALEKGRQKGWFNDWPDGWRENRIDDWQERWMDGWGVGWQEGIRDNMQEDLMKTWMAGWMEGWMEVWLEGMRRFQRKGCPDSMLDYELLGWVVLWQNGICEYTKSMAGLESDWFVKYFDSWMIDWMEGNMNAWDDTTKKILTKHLKDDYFTVDRIAHIYNLNEEKIAEAIAWICDLDIEEARRVIEEKRNSQARTAALTDTPSDTHAETEENVKKSLRTKLEETMKHNRSIAQYTVAAKTDGIIGKGITCLSAENKEATA